MKFMYCFFTCDQCHQEALKHKQEGSKGTGSLTWGKGQRSQWSHLQRTTNVVHQILVEDLKMMLYIKYENSGPCSFRQEDFWKLQFKTYFWHRQELMQPTRTIGTIFVEDHPGIISVELGKITISSSREDVIWTFPYIIQCKIVTPGAGSILILGA